MGASETLLADTGYFSEGNVTACEAAGIEPMIAMGRQPHHPPLQQRFETTPPAPENPTPVEAMAYRFKTPQGRNLYALRKQTPEPVFGIIKSVLGFRQFSLRGLKNVRGEIEGYEGHPITLAAAKNWREARERPVSGLP